MVVELGFDGLEYDDLIFRGDFVPPSVVPIPGEVLKLRKAPEDMPWCGEAKIVSDRLKALLLRFEPDRLEFALAWASDWDASDEFFTYGIEDSLRRGDSGEEIAAR